MLTATVAPPAIDYSASTVITAILATDSASDIYPTGAIAVTINGQSYTGTVVNSLSSVNSDTETATITVPGNVMFNGANTLTVTYPGDTNYLASTTTVVVTVSGAPAASFTLVGPDGGIDIPTPGPATNANIQVVPTNNFSGDVNLTCSIAKTQALSPPTCSITPTVSISGGNTGTAILTINTVQRPVYSADARTSGSDPGSTRRLLAEGGGLALCGVLLFSVPARRRSWRAMLAVLLAFGTLGIVGCGFTAGPGQGTTAGTYDVTVTGTSGGHEREHTRRGRGAVGPANSECSRSLRKKTPAERLNNAGCNKGETPGRLPLLCAEVSSLHNVSWCCIF